MAADVSQPLLVLALSCAPHAHAPNMFKGFSKRNASEAALEDDIFSPRPVHGPGAEKENQPTKAATMGAGMLPKERKPIPAKLAPSVASKSPGRDDMLLARRDRMFETVATNQAFERMLVRPAASCGISRAPQSVLTSHYRMISRSRLHFGRSLRRSSRQSRRR